MEIDERVAQALERISLLLTGFLLNSVENADQTQKIKTLKQYGFSNPEIAKLLGTTSNTVKVTVHSLKKRKKKKPGKPKRKR